LLGGLLLLGFVVVRPFLVAIAWAAILTYVSWPLHMRVVAWSRGRRSWAALATTVTLTLAAGVPLFWLGLLLREEAVAVVRDATAFLQSGEALPEPIRHIPWLGPWLQEHLVEIGGDGAAWSRQLLSLSEQWGGLAIRIVGSVGLNALGFAAALLTAFFLFRDGDRLLEQLRGILQGLLGDRVQAYFTAVGDTARASQRKAIANLRTFEGAEESGDEFLALDPDHRCRQLLCPVAHLSYHRRLEALL